MGSPEFAVPSLEILVANNYDIIAVYTQPDRPAGRGQTLTLSPVKQAALKYGITVLQPEKVKTVEEIGRLATLKPDVIVIAAYGRILPKEILELPPLGCICLHPSLLPRHRGASPVQAAILAGDRFAGASIMKVAEKVDSGPVLTRAQIPITAQDTAGTLTEKLALTGANLLLDALIHRARGELTMQPQDNALVTYSPLVAKEKGRIDWQQPAEKIWRQVRAFQPAPGAFTQWQGKRLEIMQGFPLPWTGNEAAGTAVDLRHLTDNAAFGVVTGEGVLGVCYLKLEGRRAASARDFLNGQRNFIGMVLNSQ